MVGESWRGESWRDVAGSTNGAGYVQIKIDGKLYLAHRLAFLYMTDAWPVNQGEHANRNRQDNSWVNLRDATQSQNQGNTTVYKTNKLGIKGIHLHPCGKFRADIMVRGTRKYLGLHVAKELAAGAYATAANENFKEFARVA
jgi:hypothetical protein